MATSKEIDKAYKAYLQRLKGMPTNTKNANRMTKAQFIAKNYPDYGKTNRTRQVESGLKRSGLSYAEIQRLKGKR